ncbi:MAG: hypothetical protein IKJ43_04115 [Bacilli bacterium]|nr:hypothetical protein [Bacilli bacterium]
MDLQDKLFTMTEAGSRKANVTEDMAKKARETAKKPGVIKRILSRIGARVKKLIFGKPFDDIMDDLSKPNLSDEKRKDLIEQAEERIKQTEETSWVKDSMTEEEKQFMESRKAQKLEEMNRRLREIKGEPESNFIPFPDSKDEENDISQATNVREIVAEIMKLNPDTKITLTEEGTLTKEGFFNEILIDKPVEDLILPEGFEYNDKDGITNKHNAKNGIYTSIHVKDMTKEKEESKEEEVQADKPKQEASEKPAADEIPIFEPKVEEKQEEPKVEEKQESEEPKKEEKTEEKIEQKEKLDINDDLEAFANYGEYVAKFIEEKIAPEDISKVIANIIEGNLPAGMLSGKEFLEERKNQNFQKKLKEQQAKAEELNKEIAEREKEIKESKDFIEMALGKIIKQEKELQALKDEAADLEGKLYDETQTKTALEQDKADLTSKVKERDAVIQSQGKEIFSLQRRGDKAEAAKERAEKTIEKLEDKIAELKEKTTKLKKENREYKNRVNKFELNIKTKLDMLVPDEELKRLEAIDEADMDDLEKTAVEYRKKQLVEEIKEEAKKEEKAAELEKVAEDYVKSKENENKKAEKQPKTVKKVAARKAANKKTVKKEAKIEEKEATKAEIKPEPKHLKEQNSNDETKPAPKHLKVQEVKEEQANDDIASRLEVLNQYRNKLEQLQELEGNEAEAEHKRTR